MIKNGALICLLVALLLLSLSTGSSDLGLSSVLDWLSGSGGLEDQQLYVLRGLRLPRTLTCFFVGASLAWAGTLLQSYLDNPLAEPYTLGISGGALLGTVIGITIGLSDHAFGLPLAALLGCGAVTIAIVSLARRPGVSSRALVLFGLMVSLFCGSVVVLLMSFFNPQQVYTALHWTMGYAGTPRDLWWPGLASLLAATLGWGAWRRKEIDSLLLGEELALSSGTPLGRIRLEIVAIVSLLTSASVVLMGLVGFIGLLSPHIASFVFKSRRLHRVGLGSLLIGGLLLLLADTLGRWAGGVREIPAGSLVALVGAPVLVILILKRFRHV